MNVEEMEMYDDAMQDVIEYEKEVQEHNEAILSDIDHDPYDWYALLDDGSVMVSDKMEWVNDVTGDKQGQHPEVYGTFTLTHVDQWSTGPSGDTYAGYMYVQTKDRDGWLKIPYNC